MTEERLTEEGVQALNEERVKAVKVPPTQPSMTHKIISHTQSKWHINITY